MDVSRPRGGVGLVGYRHSFGNTSLARSLLTEADAGHTEFTDEVYQNEGRYPGGEWKPVEDTYTDAVSGLLPTDSLKPSLFGTGSAHPPATRRGLPFSSAPSRAPSSLTLGRGYTSTSNYFL